MFLLRSLCPATVPGMPDAPPQPPPLAKREILATDISHFEAWWFSVECQHCPTIREFLPGQLLNAARRPGTAAELLARLRCSRCGEPPRGVTMFSHHSGTAQGPVREVTLLGARDGSW